MLKKIDPNYLSSDDRSEGPSCKHVATEREEKMEKHLLPVHPGSKDVLTALSVLGSIISSSDTDERIVKAMVELQDFV
jgi:hypothetical protein